MEPQIPPTGYTLDAELALLLEQDGALAPPDARVDAAREDAADALDAQILAGLVHP